MIAACASFWTINLSTAGFNTWVSRPVTAAMPMPHSAANSR